MGFFALPKVGAGRLDRVRARRSRLSDLVGLLVGHAGRGADGAARAPPLQESDDLKTEGGHSILLDDTPGHRRDHARDVAAARRSSSPRPASRSRTGRAAAIKLTGPQVSVNNGALEVI